MDGAQQKVLLEWLLDYELKLAARFRYYVALVYVKPFDNNANERIIEELVQRDKRDCDQYFQLEDRNAILMPHTSLDEAKKAIDRYKSLCNETCDLRYSIALYPNSSTAQNMMETAGRRLDRAIESQYGAVVNSDA